jgi:hypothetical protein
VVNATNAKAVTELESTTLQVHTRLWKPINVNELLKWLGLRFYMARHTESISHDYWQVSCHNLGRYMSRARWEQIYRYLTITMEQPVSKSAWFSKIEPIASQIRINCENAVVLSTWISIDESMVAFSGRSRHTTKLKNKPIKEGFKVWCLGLQRGYIYTWRWHSNLLGLEGTTRKPIKVEQIPSLPTTKLAQTY